MGSEQTMFMFEHNQLFKKQNIDKVSPNQMDGN